MQSPHIDISNKYQEITLNEQHGGEQDEQEQKIYNAMLDFLDNKNNMYR